MTRDYQQLVRFRKSFCEQHPNTLVPILPEPLDPSTYGDQDTTLRKAIQIERFLKKLCIRPDLMDDPGISSFLTVPLPTEESNPRQWQATIDALRSFFDQTVDRGFRIYEPVDVVDRADVVDFETKKSSILLLEKEFQNTTDLMQRIARIQAGLRKSHFELSECLATFANVEPIAEAGEFPEAETLRAMSVCFGRLLQVTGGLDTEQSRESSFHCSDVFYGFKLDLGGLKALMNRRVDLVYEFDRADKRLRKGRRNLERLQPKGSSPSKDGNLFELAKAKTEVEEAQKQLLTTRAQYLDCRTAVDGELEKFHERKSVELLRALKNVSALTLNFERLKLEKFQAVLMAFKETALPLAIDE